MYQALSFINFVFIVVSFITLYAIGTTPFPPPQKDNKGGGKVT